MKPGLIPGTHATVCFTVTPEMCPAFDGVVVHSVCSTWTVVQYMEVAGRKLLAQYLEPLEEGVGTSVSCEHIGPAVVGATVSVTATARFFNHHELVCDCIATEAGRTIATGHTTQKIMPRAVLERILSKSHATH